MKTERQPEQAIPSDDAAKLEEVELQPTPRRVANKSVLAAVVVGIITISALWLFVIRQAGSPVYEAPGAEPDVQVHESSVAKALPAAKTDPAVESISRELASMSRAEMRFPRRSCLKFSSSAWPVPLASGSALPGSSFALG